MDANGNDLEAGAIVNIPRNFNKKIRKRKHLDALLKVRSRKKNSSDLLRSSEDELFLPHQKSSITRFRSSPYRRCWYYSKRIFSFTFLCIFLILCIALISANIQLKSEVQTLSLRVNEIEVKFSNVELNNMSSMIEQIKTRLDSLEHRKSRFQDDSSQLSKPDYQSAQLSEVPDQSNDLNQKADIQLEHIINGRISEWNEQLKSFRNELEHFNQSMNIQEWKRHFEQLTNLVHNSSDQTSIIVAEFQSNLDKLRKKIDQCECSSVINGNKRTEDPIDIEQIVDGPSIAG